MGVRRRTSGKRRAGPSTSAKAEPATATALQSIATTLADLDDRVARIEYLLECGDDSRPDVPVADEIDLAQASLAEAGRISHEDLLRQLGEE
jgi:hypothetical protein